MELVYYFVDFQSNLKLEVIEIAAVEDVAFCLEK